MPLNVLDIQAMPRAERSRTRKVHDAFMRGLRAKHPDVQVLVKDLAHRHDELPVFDEWDVEAKFEMIYGNGKLDEVGAQRWNALTKLTDELHACHLLVVSAPMWNFNVPWFLKRWIDAVVQGRLTWEYVDGAYKGLLGGRRAVILTSRDGQYQPGSPMAGLDHHLPYLETILGFMGLGPIDKVIAEPMALGGPEVAAQALERAVIDAEKLGRSL